MTTLDHFTDDPAVVYPRQTQPIPNQSSRIYQACKLHFFFHNQDLIITAPFRHEPWSYMVQYGCSKAKICRTKTYLRENSMNRYLTALWEYSTSGTKKITGNVGHWMYPAIKCLKIPYRTNSLVQETPTIINIWFFFYSDRIKNKIAFSFRQWQISPWLMFKP